jgi:NADH-quinone oxidoreductase subunit J
LGGNLISPAVLLVLAVVGALAMMMLLPGKRRAAIGMVGGVVLFAVMLTLGAVVGNHAGVGGFFWAFSAIALIGAVRVITHTRPVYSALYFVLTVMATAGLFVLMWAEFMAAALVLIYAGAILVTYVFVIMLAAEAGASSSYSGTGTEAELEHDTTSREPVLASAAGFAMVGILLFVIFDKPMAKAQGPVAVVGQAAVEGSGFGVQGSAVQGAGVADRSSPSPQPSPVVPGEGVARAGDVGVAHTGVAGEGVRLKMEGATQQLGDYLFQKELIDLELAGLILTVAMVGAIVIARRRVWRGAGTVPTEKEILVAPATPIDDNPHSIPVLGTENPRQKAYPET